MRDDKKPVLNDLAIQCPSGHWTVITQQQYDGNASATCGTCGWHGSTLDGGIIVRKTEKEEGDKA